VDSRVGLMGGGQFGQALGEHQWGERQGTIPVRFLIDGFLGFLEEALQRLDERCVGVGRHGRMVSAGRPSTGSKHVLPLVC
jgi:hypothetical protein